MPTEPAIRTVPADATQSVEDLRTRPEAGQPSSSATIPEPLLGGAAAAARLCGVSEATWYRMAAAGRTPAPIRLSRGCVRWRLNELRDWIAAGCPNRREWEACRLANGRTR